MFVYHSVVPILAGGDGNITRKSIIVVVMIYILNGRSTPTALKKKEIIRACVKSAKIDNMLKITISLLYK